MAKQACVIYSRGLKEKANTYSDMLRDSGALVCVLGRRISIKDSKGRLLTEEDIMDQKLDLIKGADEVHFLWDGQCSEVPSLVVTAKGLSKKIFKAYMAPDSTRRLLSEFPNGISPKRKRSTEG